MYTNTAHTYGKKYPLNYFFSGWIEHNEFRLYVKIKSYCVDSNKSAKNKIIKKQQLNSFSLFMTLAKHIWFRVLKMQNANLESLYE